MTAISSFLGIRGFIALGLAAILAFVCWRADVISGQRDDALQSVAMEKAAHAVTTASLDQCISRSEAYVKEGQDRQKAATEALEKQKAVSQALDQQIARIRAERASTGDQVECVTPRSVMEAEGL